VVGPSKHQTNIHTHVCNEVMLVWGSLRLAQLPLYSQNPEQNCTVQDKDTLHKEEGERGKTETESKETQKHITI